MLLSYDCYFVMFEHLTSNYVCILEKTFHIFLSHLLYLIMNIKACFVYFVSFERELEEKNEKLGK